MNAWQRIRRRGTALGVLVTTVVAARSIVAQTDTAKSDAVVFGSTERVGAGFRGRIYLLPEGTARLPEDFSTLAPVGDPIYTTTIDVGERSWDAGFPGVTDRFEWFAIEYRTTFTTRAPALYHFTLTSDDGSKLFIDGRLVVDNDGGHQFASAQDTVTLTAGRHEMVVQYFQGPRYHVGLQLHYARADEQPQIFPGTDFTLDTPGISWWPWLFLFLPLLGAVVLRRILPGVQLEAPSFCLAGATTDLTARLDAAGRRSAGRFVWNLGSTPSGHALSETASAPGAAAHVTTFRAASAPGKHTVTVRRDEAAVTRLLVRASDSRTLTIWELRPSSVGYADRRIGPRYEPDSSSWNSFHLTLLPAGTTFAELLDAGEIRLVERDAGRDGRAARYVLPLRRGPAGPEFTDERLREYIELRTGELRWNGRLPAVAADSEGGAPDDDVAFDAGRYRLELMVRNGPHEATIAYEFFLDTTPSVLDLTGHWRVTEGAAEGWLMRGESHGGGHVSLHTAPGVVIGGVWRGKDPLAATVDLTPAGAGAAPSTADALDHLVTPPAVLTALMALRAESYPVLRGKPEGLAGTTLSMVKELWRVEIHRPRTTYWFDPESNQPELETAGGVRGGQVARVQFERSPRPLIGGAGEGAAARLEVFDADGTSLGATETRGAPGESAARGPVSIAVGERWLRGEGTWTGRTVAGTPCPPGAYTFLLTIRDGMAVATLEHKVLLGHGLRIVHVPRRFAPDTDAVPIEFEWLPEETLPNEVTLTVRGTDGEVVYTGEHTVERGSGKPRVTWNGKGIGSSPLDWVGRVPFTIELSARAPESGRALRDTARITVEPVRLALLVDRQEPAGEDSREYYDARDVPADVDAIPVRAELTLLDTEGNEVVASGAAKVRLRSIVYSAHSADETYRAPGFVSPESSDPEPSMLVGLEQGRCTVSYRPSSRAASFDYARWEVMDGDRFRLEASLESGGADLAAETEEFTIAPGRPVQFAQLLPGAMPEALRRLDLYPAELHHAKTYVETLASQAVGLFVDNPALRKGFEAALREYMQTPLRYLGPVADVPYRGFFGGADSRTDLPLYIAGLAGDDPENLVGGQALVVVFSASDRFGNPVPLTAREDGDRVRRPMAVIRIAPAADSGATIPPFFVKATESGYAYDGDLVASAFGPGALTLAAPLGIFACYYVPGFPATPIVHDPARGELGRYTHAREYNSLRMEVDETTDVRSAVVLEFDGKRIQAPPIELASSPWRRPPSGAAKWLRWAVAGDVSDVDTFKAEMLVSILPLVGDGRDLTIYALKRALSSRVDACDDLTAGLAGVGLALDLTTPTVVTIPVNAAVAGLKALLKIGRDTFDVGSGIVVAFARVFEPLIRIVREGRVMEQSTFIREELTRASELLRLVERASAENQLARRFGQIGELVNKCNPTTCLLPFFVWRAEFSEQVLARYERQFPQLVALFKRFGVEKLQDVEKIDEARRAFDALAETMRRLAGGADAAPSPAACEALGNLVEVISRLPRPMDAIDELAKVGDEALRVAAPALATRAFRDAATHVSPTTGAVSNVYSVIVEQLQRHGAEAAHVMSVATDARPKTFHHLVSVLDRLDAAPRLYRLSQSPHFEVLNGKTGLAHALEAVSWLAENKAASRLVGSEAVDSPEACLRLIEDLPLQFGALPGGAARRVTENALGVPVMRSETILLENVLDAFNRLTPEGFRTYVDAIELFRRADGTLPAGIVVPANAGATANLLTVARSANGQHYALEIVGTAWLISGKKPILIEGNASLVQAGVPATLTLTTANIVSFGHKGRQAADAGTLEADVLVQLGEMRVYLDWKNYVGGAEPDPAGIARAVNALSNEPEDFVEHVLIVSRGNWGSAGLRAVEQAARQILPGRTLGLGWVIPEGELLRFLGVIGDLD